MIFVTREGLLDVDFSFFGFCRAWNVKHKSFIQAKDEFVLITLSMSSVSASAAIILAPLGILPRSDMLDLHLVRCCRKSKS